MADNSNDIKSYKEKLEKAIEDGVELFKHYKEISKDFQNMQKKLMNNQELKKISANLKQKYDEEKNFIFHSDVIRSPQKRGPAPIIITQMIKKK